MARPDATEWPTCPDSVARPSPRGWGQELLEAAQEIQQFCRNRDWRFCFIGGIAVQRWGEARLTRDADLTVYTGIGDGLLARLSTP